MNIGQEKLGFSERGFTLVETLLVVGLTTLIAAGIVAGLLEGLGALNRMTNDQNVQFGHQCVMNQFISDVQSAVWFYNEETHDETGAMVLRETTNPLYLILGYPGPDGEEIWVRYKVRYGVFILKYGTFIRESYLMRTVVVVRENGTIKEQGTTSLTSGIANLMFDYADSEGNFTDQLPEVKRISMTLSIERGGTIVQREYIATLRNPNGGVKFPPGDFADVEAESFGK